MLSSQKTVIKRNGTRVPLNLEKISKVAEFITDGIEDVDHQVLMDAVEPLLRDGITTREIQRLLIQIPSELVTSSEPNWQFVASRALLFDLYKEAALNRGYKEFGYGGNFYDLIVRLTKIGRYGKYMLEHYTKDEVDELQAYIKPERDFNLSYVGLKQLADRYILKGMNGEILELTQEMYMGVAMHLAIPDGEFKLQYAKLYYNVLSLHMGTAATPTLGNARTPYPQLSSCFIDTVEDNLWSIYHVDENFSQVSKNGGGMGIYLGHVRAKGSDIRGHKHASGGTVPWEKKYNDTAVSVDQLGKRKGGVSIWQEVHHKDFLDHISLRANNGDERLRARDIFPGAILSDVFMEQVEQRGMWYMFCPHEVRTIMGYSLEDFYGQAYELRYWECVQNPDLPRKEIPAREVMKHLMISMNETGTPFTMFRDTVNRLNPNKHCGMVRSSNLCTEILQNMSGATLINVTHEDGIVQQTIKSGDFVVCNLTSVVLSNTHTPEDIAWVVPTLIRMMDNVITLCELPISYAEITNKKYRAVGLGTSGYATWLADVAQIPWSSEEHIEAADKMYEELNYHAIKGSLQLSKERGAYSMFEGSDWDNGDYFVLRGYCARDEQGNLAPIPGQERWYELALDVHKYGIRNAYLFAVAPTGQTALTSNSSAGIDPIYKKVFKEKKANGIITNVAPRLDRKKPNYWLYEEAHDIDPIWSVRACAARQRHIDQGQSFNVYINNHITVDKFYEVIRQAWKLGVKTMYYIKNHDVDAKDEFEEELDAGCDSCSA